jgi:hypothetical protein
MAKQIHAAFAAYPTRKFELMRGPFVQQRRNDEEETEKAPSMVVQKIRDAILDETFKPGERLPEEQALPAPVASTFRCFLAS